LQYLVDERTAELQQANRQLERAAVLEERQRIAAEMHDGLAQTLRTMGLKTGQAADMLQAGRQDEVLREFDEMQDIIARAVSDVRRSIASLQQNPQPRLSLQEALQLTVNEIHLCDSGPEIEHRSIEEQLILNADDQEQVLRVVQEALLNACRHARADHILIRLDRSPGGFLVAVEDDGLGFDLEEVARNNGNHFGLSIMRARAARLDGHLSIITHPGSGTSVQLSWPAEFIPPIDGYQSSVEELSHPP
jgi:signal transduction histidine kinase